MKNLLHSVILFYFSLAITGIPYSVHYCSRTNDISADYCEVCANDAEEKFSCCEDESEYPEITAFTPECCSELIAITPIKEETLLSKGKVPELFPQASVFFETRDFSSEKSYQNQYCFFKFPPGIPSDIPIAFHSLLI